MKMIKWASDIIAGNIREAKRYADEAFRLKDISPMASEWCRDTTIHPGPNTPHSPR
jgi:hypothetical protein